MHYLSKASNSQTSNFFTDNLENVICLMELQLTFLYDQNAWPACVKAGNSPATPSKVPFYSSCKEKSSQMIEVRITWREHCIVHCKHRKRFLSLWNEWLLPHNYVTGYLAAYGFKWMWFLRLSCYLMALKDRSCFYSLECSSKGLF